MLKNYDDQRKQGQEPVFRRSELPQARNVSLWGDGMGMPEVRAAAGETR